MNTLPRPAALAAAALLLAGAGALASCAHAPAAAPPAGRWEAVASANQPLRRHENGYVRVGERFYLLGGRGSRPVEIFDPATGRWTTGALPPLEMHHFQAVAHEGKIYVLGAFTGGWPREQPIPHVYVYDPAADRWERGAEIPADRRRGAAGVVVHDGLFYLVSGIQVGHAEGHVPWLDSFDPRTGQWRRLADAPRPRDHFQAAVIGGKLYAAGGRRSSQATGQGFELTVPEVDVYDLARGTWTTLPAASNLPTQRAGTAAAVLGGRLLVLGGESGSQQPAHREVEALDPASGRWLTLAPMLEGRHGTQAVVHQGRVYVAAGSKVRGADEINSHEAYTQQR